MKIGSTDITKIMYGNIAITKAYLGTTVIFGDTTPASTILSDTFGRANSTTTLGNADTGQTWVVQNSASSVWGISSNRAYMVSTTSSGYNIAGFNLAADCNIEVDITWTTSNTVGLAFRNSNNNNFIHAIIDGTGLTLKKYVNEAATVLGTYAFSPVTGTTYHLKVTLNGSSIIVSLDGSQRISVTETFNQTATFLGLRQSYQYSPYPYYDNFKVTNL